MRRTDEGQGRILVVEDDESTRRLFVAALETAGYATATAATLQEAVDVLDGEVAIICVLLDARLPDGHGSTLVRAVRDRGAWDAMPIVVITGDDSDDTELALLRAGASDFLVKPVGVDRLLARVGARLRDRASWLASLEMAREGGDGNGRRAGVEAVIANLAFRSVFQPIVDLRDEQPIGFEALTRFDDGVRPDVRFHDAASVGCGVDLELVTLSAALDWSDLLDEGTFVSLNVTPALLRDATGELQDLLVDLTRDVVLEITEREAIDDYDAVRRSVRGLQPSVTLSIDDAGAGFASLRHVVMLEPEYVKLDRTWVTDLHEQPANQAMIAGLVHFAEVTGCLLIAEGIETAEERQCLIDLGVERGQGYLLGRPEPVQ